MQRARVKDVVLQDRHIRQIEYGAPPGRLRLLFPLGAGIAGVVLLCAVTPYNDYHLKNTYLYGNHLPIGALCLFTILSLMVNPLAARVRTGLAFSRGELLLIWAMWTVGAGLASSGMWRYLGPMPVAPAYFAGSGRPWLRLFADAPGWLLLSRDPDAPAVRWFYEGLPHGAAIPWGIWLPVIAGWSIPVALFGAMSMAICALLRRQWVERERLAFPLATLPLQIAQTYGGRSLLRQPGFLLGAVFVFVHHGFSTAHAFIPAVPELLPHLNANAWFVDPPWNAIGLGAMEIYFAVIGAVYLLPVEVSFSLWFTYIAFHLVRVGRVALGYDPLMAGPLDHESSIGAGALMPWALWMLWIALPHWRQVWQAVRGRPANLDRSEPMGYRSALLIILASAAGIAAWMHIVGMPWVTSALVVLLSSCILLALTRIVAESGLLFVQSPCIPSDVMACFGTGWFAGASSGALLMSQVVLIHDPREHPMPAIANAYGIAHQTSLSARVFTRAIVLALTVGFIASFFSFVGVSYRFGSITLDPYGTTWAPQWSLDRAIQYLDSPLPLNTGSVFSMCLGGVLAIIFSLLRARFLWWPLSPIGLVMTNTYAMHCIWFSIFLGWLMKALVVRLGGLRSYRLFLPFFLGFLLGEGLYGGLAAVLGALLGVSPPPFLPT